MGLFHRYNSTIHGDYRRAYLRSGLVTGLLLAAYVLVRLLMGSPMESPTSLVVDAILLVVLFLFAAWYRNSLPEKKITLKEVLLFGIGLSLVAAVVYGVLLFAIQVAAPRQTQLFTESYQISPANYPLQYWAAWWAVVAAAGVLLLGAFGAFVAAVVLRNEKSEIKHKQQ